MESNSKRECSPAPHASTQNQKQRLAVDKRSTLRRPTRRTGIPDRVRRREGMGRSPWNHRCPRSLLHLHKNHHDSKTPATATKLPPTENATTHGSEREIAALMRAKRTETERGEERKGRGRSISPSRPFLAGERDRGREKGRGIGREKRENAVVPCKGGGRLYFIPGGATHSTPRVGCFARVPMRRWIGCTRLGFVRLGLAHASRAQTSSRRER